MDVEPIKDVNKILDKIAFYLAQRDHAPSELRKKMQHKYDVESFEQALHLAQDRGWLKSPQELSEKITELLNRKLKGYLYIQNYLKNLELPKTEMSEEIEEEKCLSLLDKRFRNWQTLNYEQKQKPTRFLLSRGFTLTTIKKVLYEAK